MKTAKPGTIAVRFINAWNIYRAGEVAGFDPATCAKLEASGIAERFFIENENSVSDVLPGSPQIKQDEIVKHEAVVPNEPMLYKRKKWARK